MKGSLSLLAGALALTIAAQDCAAQPDAAEIERREAAVGFLLPMAMALGVLRLECRQWLSNSDDDVDRVARAWWERNRADLDAATWITAEALRRYRATMPADKALAAEREILQATSRGALDVLRGMFQRRLPNPDSCRKAVQRHKHSQLDVANLGKTPGYERFAEFGETLKRVRADAAYRQMEERFRTFDNQVPTLPQPLATLDAIGAAREKGDAPGVVRGFESLAERGDGKAAQTLGMYHLNGQHVPRNAAVAYAWFYNAWVMGQAEGINALGVMWRDALGVPADRKLALAAFALARSTAGQDKEALQRASSNYTRLVQEMDPKDVAEASCMKWETLHERLRESAAKAQAVQLRAKPTPPAQPGRQCGN